MRRTALKRVPVGDDAAGMKAMLASRARAPRTLAAALADPGDPLRALVEGVRANIFVADLDLTLVYLNAMARDTVRRLESDLQRSFRVGSADLLGGSIHRFHHDPARVERILRDPRSFPHDATFAFGGTTLETRINAVLERGEVVGYVVAWDDVSGRDATSAQRSDDIGNRLDVVSRISDDLAAVSAQTTDRAAQAAEGTSQLRLSVQEIARASASTTSTVDAAVDAVASSTEALGALLAASAEIGEFVRLITGVADQTKLLALNATIEAARAGDVGRGFAVVAEEVKQLATATASSSEDIQRRIAAIQSGTSATADGLRRVDDLIAQVRDSQVNVAAALEEQAAVVSEIARASDEIAQGAGRTSDQVRDIRSATEGVRAEVEALRGVPRR